MSRTILWGLIASLVGTLQLAVAEHLLFQSRMSSQPRTYVKIGQAWCAERGGELHRLLTDSVVVQFNPAKPVFDIKDLLAKHKLIAEEIDPAGTIEFALLREQDAVEVLLALRQSTVVQYAAFKMAGDTLSDHKAPPTEMIVADKRFARKADTWYIKSRDRMYKVKPKTLSLKFRKALTDSRQEQFLAKYQFKVLRENRLGIYDEALAQTEEQ